jgi:hypothetical protein
MFANLKWFPGFFGKLTLEIYPSYKNLVVCPIISEQIQPETADAAEKYIKLSSITNAVGGDLAASDVGSNIVGFRQINTTVIQGFNQAGDHTFVSLNKGIFRCTTSTTDKCHIRLAETVVRMDVYNQVLS